MKYLSKNIISLSVKIFLVLFLFLPFGIPNMEFIKTYMVFVVVLFLLFHSFVKINNFHVYEVCWLLLLLFLMLTIFYCDSFSDGIKAVFGEILLIAFYFLYRFFLADIGFDRYSKILVSFGKFYFIISLIYYFLGIYFYFGKGIDQLSILYPDQVGRVLGATINKWSRMPRLNGLTLGADSFNWMSTFFILNFLMNKKIKWAIVGVICSLLTFSLTFITIVSIITLFFIIKKGKLLSVTMIMTPVIGAIFFFYQKNEWFHNVIEARLNSAQTGTGRFNIWEFLFGKIIQRPIFGHGINQLKAHIDEYPDKSIRSAHNTLIEILFNGGILAAFMYSCFVLSFYLFCYNLDRKNNSAYFRGFFLCYFIFSMANTSIYNFSTVLFFTFVSLYYYSLKKKQIN